MYNESDCIFGEVMKKNIICILTICSACLSLLYARGNKAESFPRKDREITIICPQPEGGGTDAIIRALTEELNKDKAAHFTVKNISGRGTSDGTDYVLSLPADGYTILVGGTHTITATMQGKTDGYKKLETIAGLNEDPFVIGVKKNGMYASFGSLVKKAKSGKDVVIGHSGTGSATHASCIGLNIAFGHIFTLQQCAGGAGILEAVKSGACDAGIFSQSEIVAAHDILPVLILTQGHSTLSQLSSVPTFADCGYTVTVPGFSYRSLMVRKGTPQQTKERLADMVTKAYMSYAFQQFQKRNGLIQAYSTLKESDVFMNELIREYMPIMKETDLYSGSGYVSEGLLKAS